MRSERLTRVKDTLVQMGVQIGCGEHFPMGHGKVFYEMRDSRTGEILYEGEIPNVVTLDAGILSAILYKDSQNPVPNRHNGVFMLAVGTGATGNILSPDAPQPGQRKLNNEICRKPFSATQYRNTDGVAVAYPTNIVDFTATFGESEAVGALNEMGLIAPYSHNPFSTNPINNGPSDYDPTIVVSGKDLLSNYTTFGVQVKPAHATVTWTWRFTMGG